jgi:hypothetical protein
MENLHIVILVVILLIIFWYFSAWTWIKGKLGIEGFDVFGIGVPDPIPGPWGGNIMNWVKQDNALVGAYRENAAGQPDIIGALTDQARADFVKRNCGSNESFNVSRGYEQARNRYSNVFVEDTNVLAAAPGDEMLSYQLDH